MEERDMTTPDGGVIKVAIQSIEDLIAKPSDKDQREYKALAVDIATRSLTQMGLEVPNCPPELHPEWIPFDKVRVAEAQRLGFVFAPESMVTNSLHNDGTGRAIYGDVILMVIPRWKKEALDEAQKQKEEKIHGIRRTMAEESEYLNAVNEANRRAGHNDVKAIVDTKTSRVTVTK